MTDLTAVSLFAGIGGIDYALEEAGIAVKAAVEIDKECRGVLARHFPDTTLFEDVTEVSGDDLRAAGFVPERGVLASGWPCQGNSVAGLRGGMADPRSGLWRHNVRLLAETRPLWFIGENVPGLLSINDGLDFYTVLSDLDELGYGVAWAVLDAQWFGVAQRRRRVFLVGCLGDGAAPVEVLFDPAGVRRHLAAGTETGPGTPGGPPGVAGDGGGERRLAGTLAASAGSGGLGGAGQSASAITSRLVEDFGGWGAGEGEAEADRVVAATLQGGGFRGHRVDAEGAAGGHLIPYVKTTRAHGPAGSDLADENWEASQVAPTLNGFELGPSRAATLIPQPVAIAENQRGEIREMDVSPALGLGGGKPGTGYPAVAVPVALRGRGEGNRLEVGGEGDPAYAVRSAGGGSSMPMVAHALTSEGADASEDGTGRGTPLVAVPVDLRNAARTTDAGDTAGTGIGLDGDPSFTVSATSRAIPGVAAPLTAGSATGPGVNKPGRRLEDDVNLVTSLAVAGDFSTAEDVAQAVRAANRQPGVVASTQIAVRRLTPKECERLQGLLDDWTRWTADGKELSDSARYRMIGNSVAVPCVLWIAQGIVAVDALIEAAA